MVFSGLVIACRFATCPTSRSPVLVNATTDGVVAPPSSLAMTLGSPPSITATQELVVPRSIPIILAINLLLKISAASRLLSAVGPRLSAHSSDESRRPPTATYKCFKFSVSRMRSGLLSELSELLSMFRCGKVGVGCGNALPSRSRKGGCPRPPGGAELRECLGDQRIAHRGSGYPFGSSL